MPVMDIFDHWDKRMDALRKKTFHPPRNMWTQSIFNQVWSTSRCWLLEKRNHHYKKKISRNKHTSQNIHFPESSIIVTMNQCILWIWLFKGDHIVECKKDRAIANATWSCISWEETNCSQMFPLPLSRSGWQWFSFLFNRTPKFVKVNGPWKFVLLFGYWYKCRD